MNNTNKNNKKNNNKPNSGNHSKPAVKGNNKPLAKGNTKPHPADEAPIRDARFSKLHFDPRFQKLPKNETKVKIDQRFSRMFTDKNFNDFTNIDRYGRGASTDQTSQLKKFYALEDEDREADVAEEDERSEHESDEDNNNDNEDINSSDDDDALEDEELQEGRIGLLTVSRDDASSSESSDDDEALVESSEDEPEEDVPLGDETKRLAVLNCDWDYMRAVDLLAVCQSFVPSQGSILHVYIYPSNLGLEQMAREQEQGPDVFSEDSEQDEESVSKSGSESKKGKKAVSIPKLRKREMSKLKYYFGVVVCDSLATSRALYEALDGMEIEGSAQAMDLRYIPDEQQFNDRTPTSSATPSDVPADYKPPTFGAGPVGHTKIDLTWDRTDPHRQRVMNEVWRVARDRNEKGYGVKESDFSAYLASSESSEEELSDEESKSTDKEKIRARYASLLSGFKDEGAASAESEGDMDMEVTFTSGLSELAEQLIEKKKRAEEDKDKTVWEQYLDKRREKKREHRKRKREADEDSEREYDENDPFGDRDNEDEAPVKASKKKNKRKDNKKTDSVENKQREAELELLITDLKTKSDTVHDEDERPRKKHKSDAADKNNRSAEFDLDPRFARLTSDPRFAIDPTNPQAKKTSATSAINQVKAKQRQQSQANEVTEQTERPLSSLVASIKNKTQQHFNKGHSTKGHHHSNNNTNSSNNKPHKQHDKKHK